MVLYLFHSCVQQHLKLGFRISCKPGVVLLMCQFCHVCYSTLRTVFLKSLISEKLSGVWLTDKTFTPHPPTLSPTRGEGEQELWRGTQSPSPALGEGLGVRAMNFCQSTRSGVMLLILKELKQRELNGSRILSKGMLA